MRTHKRTVTAAMVFVSMVVVIPSMAVAQTAKESARAFPPGPSAPVAATASANILGGPPKVFYACYIPSSGVTYRIKEVDVKQTCSADHVMFSWTDGGTPGPQGPKGDPGQQGVPGPQGDPGVSGFTQTQTVNGSEVTVAAGDLGTAFANCPAGWVATGGGYYIVSYGGLVPPVVVTSRSGPALWTVALTNALPGAAGPVKFLANVVCAK